MQAEVIIPLKANLVVNDYIVPLNDFTQNYIGNVMKGIVRSLGHDSKEVTVDIDKSALHISTEKGDVPIVKDFTKLLVESTIKGILSPLKGIIWLQRITIKCMDSETHENITD